MYKYRTIILFQIYTFLFILHVNSSTARHSGHLKPFGSSGPYEQIHVLTNGFPNPIGFFDQYVSKSRPVLFQKAIINDPNLSIWDTDDQLHNLFLNNKDIVHVETRKKESRQQDIFSMSMTEFLKRYQDEELYLVEEVPNLLRPYFTLPDCLQCEPALETFQVAMLWFSSGNTSSVVHTDDYDNINCVLQGTKQFILVDPHKHKEVASEIIDNYSGSFSSIDVDHVDYDTYPSLDNKNVHYYRLNLTKGDCLFLPSLWIHQVRSYDRNIAVNYWLDHERVRNAVVNKHTCSKMGKSDFLKLDTIEWSKESSNIEYFKTFMLDLVNNNKNNFKLWAREFSKELNYDLRTNVKTITLFAELFNMLDLNGNSLISENEIESCYESGNITNAYDIIQEILDIVETKSDQSVESTSSSVDSINNQTLSDDESDDNMNSIFEHDDL